MVAYTDFAPHFYRGKFDSGSLCLECIYIYIYICRRETELYLYVKRLWVSSFQGLALNMLRIGLWRPVLTAFWPIVHGTPLWDPRYAFFPLLLLTWLPRHIYLAFSLHFYRGKLNNGLTDEAANVYIYSSVFPTFLRRKVEQWPCCRRSKCRYLAFSLHFYWGKLNNGVVADAANVYI